MGYSPWGCKESDRTEQLSLTYTAVVTSYMAQARWALCNDLQGWDGAGSGSAAQEGVDI